jgi:hypothetical protein
MKEEAERAIDWFEKTRWHNVGFLKEVADNLLLKYRRLNALFPTANEWHPIATRQLVFYLHHRYEIDFGVCPYYRIGKVPYCVCEKEIMECLCDIPQPEHCVHRDNNAFIENKPPIFNIILAFQLKNS